MAIDESSTTELGMRAQAHPLRLSGAILRGTIAGRATFTPDDPSAQPISGRIEVTLDDPDGTGWTEDIDRTTLSHVPHQLTPD